ncbi:ribbon-helix-helix protein, CopG family [Aestuariimicrobium sp. p3-SID1156]|uniref:type II toxin-antitoxin system VapB family antitoxin n=1 Tax=Aestuariimicrobium sp. p3-SID1156 TaxID=2916038 RepID=UPI00223A74D7|nr:ribbon-helix-helix protein, CopG family [Aestuariimicrobium sp. p3-SID1156]MCT1457984.1 ribbon-helix-helix protein, CopG family [Aestuariimicrobium sp. p3-SID1156]
MPDVLIRNFPQHELKLLDDQAARLGLSRSELIRRKLHEEAVRSQASVSASQLSELGDLFSGLGDEELMRTAWS